MRLIFVGFGTVGRGAAESLLASAPAFAALGASPRIVAVVDPIVGSVYREEGLDPARLLQLADGKQPLAGHEGAEAIDDLADALARAHADVLVELTPTNLRTGEPGIAHVRAAIEAGLHVVTTNKGPIALAHRQLAAAAREAGVQLRYEGTVMSGTPVLSVCEAGLAGAGIRAIRGVLNGTCNFMLTEMEAGVDYADALVAAQAKGYAEADPSGDVDGWDAAAKALILANCVLGARLGIDDVARTGIGEISREDVAAAMAGGQTWRLVARIDKTGDGWRAAVAPELVPRTDPLGALTGPGNLLVLDTEALGNVVISGPGAGRRATGHAVVADLLTLRRRGTA